MSKLDRLDVADGARAPTGAEMKSWISLTVLPMLRDEGNEVAAEVAKMMMECPHMGRDGDMMGNRYPMMFDRGGESDLDAGLTVLNAMNPKAKKKLSH